MLGHHRRIRIRDLVLVRAVRRLGARPTLQVRVGPDGREVRRPGRKVVARQIGGEVVAAALAGRERAMRPPASRTFQRRDVALAHAFMVGVGRGLPIDGLNPVFERPRWTEFPLADNRPDEGSCADGPGNGGDDDDRVFAYARGGGFFGRVVGGLRGGGGGPRGGDGDDPGGGGLRGGGGGGGGEDGWRGGGGRLSRAGNGNGGRGGRGGGSGGRVGHGVVIGAVLPVQTADNGAKDGRKESSVGGLQCLVHKQT